LSRQKGNAAFLHSSLPIRSGIGNLQEIIGLQNAQKRLHEEGPAAIFRNYNLDVIVLPTEFNSARLGAVGWLPVGTVPLGYDDIKLPFGLAFVGKRYDEGTVIRAMSAYEANFPARRVPTTIN